MPQSGLHIAIIMDGNGRWAISRHLPRSAGHRAGVEAIRRVLEAAPGLGVGTLTLYAFSSDNWKRPAAEVQILMTLLRRYLTNETRRLADAGVCLQIIGRRDRLPSGLGDLIQQAEDATAGGSKLNLRIALDYSSRDELWNAVRKARSREAFSKRLGPDVDMLIRTGGEQRLSDFLLWECAYAELYFTERMWPDFDVADLSAALAEFHSRERRFGALPELAAG